MPFLKVNIERIKNEQAKSLNILPLAHGIIEI
jgi:hypothetical protein